MILDYLLNIGYNFILDKIIGVFTALPDVTANNDLTTAIISFKGYFSSVDNFVPLSVIFAIIAFELSFELSVFTYKLVRWGYQKVPFIK